MNKKWLLIAAAAILMTACSPDRLTHSDQTANNNSASDNSGMNGQNENGTGTTDGAYRRDDGTGTGTLRRTAEGSASALKRALRRELPDDTLGDLDGDGRVENTLIDGPDNAVGSAAYRTVRHVKTAEDARNFIGANVLSLCQASLPDMAAVRILPDDELDTLKDKAGLTDVDGVRDVVLMEAAGDDEDFSVMVLRTDGTHTTALSHALGSRVDTDKLHRCGEKTVSVTLDDDVVVLSGDKAEVAAALQALVKAADRVYDYVGSARIVTG